jgi:hypothetical protein
MELTPYVEGLHRELVVAAEAGGDEARAVAERLVAPLESAVRLALLEALSAAADEITRDLAPGSVEVRLRGRDPDFVVVAPPADQAYDVLPADIPSDAAAAPEPPADAEEGTSRLTLRLPTHLKPRIDDAANRAGLSVNAWLVRTVAAALAPDRPTTGAGPRPGGQLGRRYSGWVR